MFNNRIFQAVVLTASISTQLAAQDSTAKRQTLNRMWSDFARRSSFSVAAIQTRPQGTLGRNIGFGYGFSGAYQYRLDDRGALSIRGDLAGVVYGNEWKRSPLSETIGGRVLVDTRTTNYIVPVSVGPQLAWPSGPVRPYINAGVGAQTFVTESAVEGIDNFSVIAASTNESDVALMWVAGGGIYVPMVPGATRVQLDVSVQYLNGGRARYLAPGSIVDLPGGGLRITSFESTTRLVMLRVGARIGL